MTTTTNKGRPRTTSPKPGMIIEPVITYEELPIVTEQARQKLLDSLRKGEESMSGESDRSMSAVELKAEMRKSFEEVTGYKIP